MLLAFERQTTVTAQGYCWCKKIQKSEKKSEVLKPQLDFFFFFFFFFCVFGFLFMFLATKFDRGGGWVGVVWPIRFFLGFLLFFYLDKTPSLKWPVNFERQTVVTALHEKWTVTVTCFCQWYYKGLYPANTGHSPNVVSMLGQRRRRWANIETALGDCWGSVITFVK